MATKPRVHEIFSNQALDRTTNFRYEKQETIEKIQLPQKSKKGLAPQPPGMKKFGGYKPKILAGQDDLVEIQNHAASLALSDASPSGKAHPAPRPPVQLTKPKPWVVGDKNVPMVLGGRDRDDWAGQEATNSQVANSSGAADRGSASVIDGPVEVHVQNGNIVTCDDSIIDDRALALRATSESSVVSDTSTLVRSSGTGHEPDGFDNPALGSLDSLAFSDNNNNNNSSNNKKSAFDEALESGLAFVNGSFTPPLGDSQIGSSVDSDPHLYEEPVTDDTSGVYIPEPDYDEDEQTLDFTSEETSDEDAAERRERVGSGNGVRSSVSSQSGNVYSIPQYEGEDLSHYLSDDEADGLPVSPFDNPMPAPTYNGKTKPKKSVSKKSKPEHFNPRPKLSQKHSLFKDSSSTNGTLQSKAKRKGKAGKSGAQSAAFNSVRSFSYADSKYGTKGRAAGREMMMVSPGGISHDRTFSSESEPVDDSDMFLSATNQASSYESFLRSRHGQSMPTESSDSGVEMAEDAGGEGGGVWKRLTWRLRNRNSKNYSLAE
ncbi:hypothetical protein ElyMa_002559700 [Elysia marginata]|uniref:Uncharacterized protein n=1 Tax=Elysia marginata TaxID=1093978 RepID=A0AAV4GXG7_9GAST|nr:hypothetical protein ElyMa_002559700 [Elysia marginata]